jgi:phosphoglycolate phosphatase
MAPTVLLFDIDGTLLDTGGAGRRAIDRAFEARFGRRDAC